MGKNVIWSDQAQIQLRVLIRPPLFVFCMRWPGIWKPAKGMSSASRISNRLSSGFGLVITVSASTCTGTRFA